MEPRYASVEDLTGLIGMVVTRVRRIFYVLPDGTMEGDNGDLELGFDDGSHRVLGVGGDGERLTCGSSEWFDPFPLPMPDRENDDFIRSSGKWIALDLTRVPPYDLLVGAIRDTTPIMSGGSLTGVVLLPESGHRVDVRCDGDEVRVIFQAG